MSAFPEPRRVTSLFDSLDDEMDEYSFSNLSSGWIAERIGDEMALRYPFDELVNAHLKQVPGAHWDSDRKCWVASVNRWSAHALVDFLKRWGFVFHRAVSDALREAW